MAMEASKQSLDQTENAEKTAIFSSISVHCYIPNNLKSCSTGPLHAETCLLHGQANNGPVLCCVVLGLAAENPFLNGNGRDLRQSTESHLFMQTNAFLSIHRTSSETSPKPLTNGCRISGCYLNLIVRHNTLEVGEIRLENQLIDSDQIITLVYDQERIKASELLLMNGKVPASADFLCRQFNPNTQTPAIKPLRSLEYLKSTGIIEYSSTSRQLLNRISQISYILLNFRNMNLKTWNCVWIIFFDLLLGYFVFERCRNIGHLTLLDSFLLILQNVVDQLQELIQWLMGVPAGLKLNQPLTTALGKFFIYHLELWRTYMNIIYPILSFIVSMFHIVGWCGITFQISVISDLISIATFHCYCFYVYATRLYGAQVAGLLSTWRMFRGKKFNPFRVRVDSGEFDTDQLFVGMVLFTVLVFMLPTTALYYAVFLTLRCTILAVQGMTSKLCWVLNCLPIYSLMLWVLKSSKVAGDVRIEVVRNTRPLTFALTTVPISLTTTCKLTYPDCASEYKATDYWRLFANIKNGELLHP